MNITTKKYRFIRAIKAICYFGAICWMVIAMALMFCEWKKVAVALFSEGLIGAFLLTSGLSILFIGFVLGVWACLTVLESNDEKPEQKLSAGAPIIKSKPSSRKSQPKAHNTKAINSKTTNAKAPSAKVSRTAVPNAAAPSAKPKAVSTEKTSDTSKQNLFVLLAEFDDEVPSVIQEPEEETPAAQEPEEAIDNVTTQEEVPSVEES